MVTKIRLNDEQWQALQALLEANTRRHATDQIRVTDRLRSNGFVATDLKGGNFLTVQGRERLSQGR